MNNHPRILFVDAYDSFSENIVSLLRQLLDAEIHTIKIDADLKREDAQSQESLFRSFDAVVLGPGPGNPTNPADIGLFDLVWKYAAEGQIPILGICLGFQSLCTTFGLPVTRLDLPCHGHAKSIRHSNGDIFKDAGEVIATCYNSLGVRLMPPNVTPEISRPASSASNRTIASDSSFDFTREDNTSSSECGSAIPDDTNSPLSVLASDYDDYVMAIRHRHLPFWGLQFHPESCKSNAVCEELLSVWWNSVQAHNAEMRPTVPLTDPLRIPNVLSTPIRRGTRTVSPILACMQSLVASIDKTVLFRRLSMAIDRQQLADLCHCLSINGCMAMLESTKRGRFSIFTFSDDSTWHLIYQDEKLSIVGKGEMIREETIPLPNAMEFLEHFLSANLVKQGASEVPFWGGLVGFFSYEAGLDLLSVSTKDGCEARSVPDFSLMWIDRSIVVDHEDKTIIIQSIRPDDDQWLQEMTSTISSLSCTQQHTRH